MRRASIKDTGFTTQPIMKSYGYKNITTAPDNVPDLVEEAGIGWGVRTEPLFLSSGLAWDGEEMVEEYDQIDTGHRIVLTSKDEQLAVVGSQWAPVDNYATFAPFESFIQQGLIRCIAMGSTDNKRGVFAMFRIDGAESGVFGDELGAFLYVLGDHSGQGSHRLVVNGMALSCMNQMGALRRKSGKGMSWAVRHVGNAEARWAQIEGALGEARFGIQNAAMRGMALTSVAVQGESWLRDYFARVMKPSLPSVEEIARNDMVPFGEAIERRINMFPRAVDRLVELYEEGAGQEMRSGMWRAYNAVTQLVTHERGRDNIRLRNAVDGQGAAITRRAEELALAA